MPTREHTRIIDELRVEGIHAYGSPELTLYEERLTR